MARVATSAVSKAPTAERRRFRPAAPDQLRNGRARQQLGGVIRNLHRGAVVERVIIVSAVLGGVLVGGDHIRDVYS